MHRPSPPSLVHEEGLPCLSADEKIPPGGDSALSEAFSSVSTRPSDRCRKWILLFFLLAVLCLAVIVAFVLGQYISEWSKTPDSTADHERHANASLSSSSSTDGPTSKSSSTSLVTHKPRLKTTPPHHPLPPSSSGGTPYHAARLIPLAAVKNLTLEEVFVPHRADEEDWTEMSHSSDQRVQRDALLVPLSQSVRPTQYDIKMDITEFAEKQLVTANISIHLMSYGNSTDEEIVFHAGNELKIHRIRLRSGDGNLAIISIKQELNKKLYRLLLKERLKRAEYLLEMEYTAAICGELVSGVNCYFEPVPGPNGTSVNRVKSFTTKFEPALARSFLPCWDEPAVKAVFHMTVRHDTYIKVLSNTGAMSTRHDAETGTTTTDFKPTPPMSSYLLALAAGEFVCLEMQTRRKLPLNIWTFPEDLARASFAAEFAPKMFDMHEEELESSYPLSKLDMVAARSFIAGAMENWGLVIFDSSTLLQQAEIDDSMAMTVDRHHHEYRIAKIITHELAHQWFGNLVTMRDWSELWLNEGFASFFVYEMLASRYPHLTDHEYYNRLAILLHKQSGMDRPALVRVLSRESQVEAAFHTTHLYTKGCVVVRMIRDLVSAFDFSTAMKRYLRNNAYAAVSRQELFASLPVYADHGAENERLDDVIESWLINEGMPEVTVSRKYDTDGIRVTQRLSRGYRYKVYLYEDASNRQGAIDPTTFSFTDNTYNSEEVVAPKTRRSVDTERSREFDDSKFENLPSDYVASKNKQRHRKKNRNPKPRKPSGIMVEKREEDLTRKSPGHIPSERWSIPFSYMFGSVKSSEGQVIRQFWLRNRSISFTDVELSANSPLVANPDWAYPYRVNYDYANWKMLTRLLHDQPNEVPIKSRMQLIVDGEFFLSESGLPHLYLYLLGYLQREHSLGAALLGMDAVHRVIQAFQGTSAIQSMLKYFTPVVANFDRLLIESQSDIQLAAVWLIDPHRLTRFYQLRCAVNLTTCEKEEEVRAWLNRGHYTSDMHQKTTALCHYLAINGGRSEAARIEAELSKASPDPTMLQLATCVRDSPAIAAAAARIVVAQRNAAVYDSVLRSDLTEQHYNFEFRRALWSAIGALPETDRRFLFSVDELKPSPKSISLLHAIRTTKELELVKGLLPSWGRVAVHIQFLSRQLAWQERVADGVLSKFFSIDSPSL